MKKLGKKILLLCMGSGLILLSACKKEHETPVAENNAMEQTETPVANSNEGVKIEGQQTEEQTEQTLGDNALDKKVINENATLYLEKVENVGQILMVEMRLVNKKFKFFNLDISEIYIIDDTTAKKYDLLKDDSGKFMASPISGDGSTISIREGIISLKFPALPKESKTVSITIDSWGTFNGVTIKK